MDGVGRCVRYAVAEVVWVGSVEDVGGVEGSWMDVLVMIGGVLRRLKLTVAKVSPVLI